MGEYNTEGILISIMIIVASFTTLTFFYTDLTTQYDVTNYYDSNLTSYNETFQNIKEDSEQIDTAINSLTSGNLQDIIGGLVQGLLGILGVLTDSFIGIGAMLAQSIGLFDLGPMGPVWIGVATTAIVLILALGIKSKVIK